MYAFFQGFVNKGVYHLSRALRETGLAADVIGSRMTNDIAYLEPLSRHRNIMPLYDLRPQIYSEAFIAPNSTIVGEVTIGENTTIWYGAVIRGDINAVRIASGCSIGDNCVIHTAGSLPTGIPASVNIGHNVNIQGGSTLYSCTVDDDVFIGYRSVILEGAQLERGCHIGPNSVVPPGRIIPAGQFWAGNPVEYVRDISKGELGITQFNTGLSYSIGLNHQYEFLQQNSAYLQKQETETDVRLRREDYTAKIESHDRAKY